MTNSSFRCLFTLETLESRMNSATCIRPVLDHWLVKGKTDQVLWTRSSPCTGTIIGGRGLVPSRWGSDLTNDYHIFLFLFFFQVEFNLIWILVFSFFGVFSHDPFPSWIQPHHIIMYIIIGRYKGKVQRKGQSLSILNLSIGSKCTAAPQTSPILCMKKVTSTCYWILLGCSAGSNVGKQPRSRRFRTLWIYTCMHGHIYERGWIISVPFDIWMAWLSPLCTLHSFLWW